MPFDPRPRSRGGNKGIDEEFSRSASPGKFRVVGVDTFDGTDWVYSSDPERMFGGTDTGDFATLQEAKEFADKEIEKHTKMLKVYVYNDQGDCVYDCGSF